MPSPTEFLRVSYSSLNVLEGCNRKFEFRKLYPKAERIKEDFYAAECGKALHEGQQEYLVNRDFDRAIWAFMQKFPYQLEFDQENDYRGFDACLNTLEEMLIGTDSILGDYELAHIKRPNTVVELAAGLTGGVVVPAIEVPFEIRFKGITLPDGRGIAFNGFLDAALYNRKQNRFRTCDIKTSRLRVEDATPKYKYDAQQVPYGLVLDHIAQGTVESFSVLYYDCYIDLVDASVKAYEFTKTRTDIEEWIINKAIQFRKIEQLMLMDYFPRTDSGCLSYGKPCVYLEPCQSRSKPDLTNWFLAGSKPAVEEVSEPWIVADIELG